HGVERSDCLLFGREALDPLALEAGLLDLGTDRVLLCRTAQGVANAGDLFDLAEEDDAPIEHSDRLVCVPVASVGRLGISQEVARRGDAVEAERDRVLAGDGPRQAALAPERDALAQGVGDFAPAFAPLPRHIRTAKRE